MQIKKSTLLSFLMFTCSAPFLHSSDQLVGQSIDIFDEMDGSILHESNSFHSRSSHTIDIFDEMDETDMEIEDFLDTLSFDPTARRAIPIQNILGIIEDIGAFRILEQDLYLRTNPFVKRSLLDLPLWELHACSEPEPWIVGVHLFWNHMDRSVFTCKSSNISCFLDLDQETLFGALDQILPQVSDLFPEASLIDPLLDKTTFNQTLDLFRNFTVQQRRIGAMMHMWRQWDRVEIRALLPLYYIERNIFAKPAEQRAIEERFGVLDPEEAEQFQKNHAISDKLGFGDLRFEADFAASLSDTFALRFGAFTTLPTAFAIKKGLRGTCFLEDLKQPTFDLQELFDLIFNDGDLSNPTISTNEQNKAYDLIVGDLCRNKNGFLLGALDRMNAILLETKLGNSQHLGIGFMFRTRTSLRALLDEYEWADNISWNNRGSIEYLAPSTETRFFIKRNQPSDFSSRDFDSTDPIIQKANLAFLEMELVDKFYPYAIKTRIQPGVIFHWMSRWCFSGEVWDLSIGSDFWLQHAESFESFNCIDPDIFTKLDLCNAQKEMAYQFKTFGSLAVKILRADYTVYISLNGEGTNWNKGIGDDWTASLNIEANF